MRRTGIIPTSWCAAVLMTASVSFARQSPSVAPPSSPAPVTSLPPSPVSVMHNPPWYPTPLVPLEQGIEDRSTLDETLRVHRVELLVPNGFKQVYQVPGRDDLFMRVNGGMFAVFPESYYKSGKGGEKAMIPAGTVFYIGAPPIERPVQPGEKKYVAPPPTTSENELTPGVNTRWDRRVPVVDAGVERLNEEIDPDVPVGRDGDAAPPLPVPRVPRAGTPIRTVATDDAFRMKRLSELLDRATKAVAKNQQP